VLAVGVPEQVRQLFENIYLFTYRDADAADLAYKRLSLDPRVRSVQYNYRLDTRSVPDDPLYGRQDNLDRVGYPEVWEQSTGGTTATGVPIVTAILDAGFDTEHEDLRASIWRNPAEIPDDGIDNDGNGYVDDVNGWNYRDDRADHPPDPHGTRVAGLIGAVGDNGVGITGMNWRSELMLFSVSEVADIIAAYGYIIEQRQRFNESGGIEGAFVVVTNASFGVAQSSCRDFPVWGEMYDKLGATGVLTAAGVVNTATDIDLRGDMPTDCPSEYLITVTDLTTEGELSQSAGYGVTTVDLAAPGQGSFTTLAGDRYGGFGGTSAAVTYVTAAIAWLYAAACPESIAESIDFAPAAAARMKRLLLQHVQPLPPLAGKTVSGGMVNVAEAQTAMRDECRKLTPARIDILKAYPNPTSGKLTVVSSVDERLKVRVYDSIGRILGLPVEQQGVVIIVDFTGRPPGHYVVEVTDSEHSARRIIVVY
jgi:hypothetical protein